MIGHDYDNDPEALAWARAYVERVAALMDEWEKYAAEKGTTDPKQWRRFACLLRDRFIGGSGCVIAAFDERKPEFNARIAAAGNDPHEVAF